MYYVPSTAITQISQGSLIIIDFCNDFHYWEIVDMTFQFHNDVIKWKHFPCYWPFVRGIHRSPVDCHHKDQWRGALMFSFICAWTNGWANNRNLRRHRAHYDITVMLDNTYIDTNGFSRVTIVLMIIDILTHEILIDVDTKTRRLIELIEFIHSNIIRIPTPFSENISWYITVKPLI